MSLWKDHRRSYLAAALISSAVLFSSFGEQAVYASSDSMGGRVLLHLGFDEGEGNQIEDLSGNLEPQEVNYRYTSAAYTANMDPEWREHGIEGGSLLFDGNSTYIGYNKTAVTLSGEELSISVWVAPRAFEWDDPNAAENGEACLTAIVSQYSKEKNTGVLLGYERYGRVCFEVGTGEEWYTVWGDDNLIKDQWNHLTAVFDGTNGTISLYLNGELSGSQTIDPGKSIAGATTKKLFIGKNNSATAIAAGEYNMFSGLMDELYITSDVMSEEVCTAYSDVPEVDYEDVALENILTDDIYKTQYHGGPYQNWMNEPHAPVYYNGKYHLFFQQNMVGTYWRNIQWGHLVSDDLVNWTPIKEAICATEDSVVPDGVWSGNAAYDVNGVPLLFFTAGNDSYAEDGLISNQNIGVAYPADLTDPNLTDWVIYDQLAVQQEDGQGRAGEFRDPYIWKEGDIWCMLVCSGSSTSNGGSALLYTSDTLELLADGTIDMDWQYKGPVYEMENQNSIYGTSWELPIMVPLTNEEGTITKYAFFISPAPASTADNKVYFFLGDFDAETGKFTPDEEYADNPGLIDYGDNVFTGPSIMYDSETGTATMFSIMQDKRSGAEEGASGWAHCVGLTREIWLNDDGTDLRVKPIDTLENYETEVLLDTGEADLTVDEANDLLQDVQSDQLHISIMFDVSEAHLTEEFGIAVKAEGEDTWTKYWYQDGQISSDTTSRGSETKPGNHGGSLELEDGKLTMNIYIDRSLVEAYFNESKSISTRSYSDFGAQSIYVYGGSQVKITQIHVAAMGITEE